MGVIDFEFQGNPEHLEVHVFEARCFTGRITVCFSTGGKQGILLNGELPGQTINILYVYVTTHTKLTLIQVHENITKQGEAIGY